MSRISKEEQYKKQRTEWKLGLDALLTGERFRYADGLAIGVETDDPVDLIELAGKDFLRRMKYEDDAAKDGDFGSRDWLGTVGYNVKGTVDCCRPVYLSSDGHEFMRARAKAEHGTEYEKTRIGTLDANELTKVMLSVYPPAIVADASPAQLDKMMDRLFEGGLKYGPDAFIPESDPYNMHPLFQEEECVGQTLPDNSLPSVQARMICGGAPMLHVGQSCAERFRSGDGQKFFPGRLTHRVMWLMKQTFAKDRLNTQVHALLAAVFIEAVSGIATEVRSSATWRESLESISRRMDDPSLPAFLPCRIRPVGPASVGSNPKPLVAGASKVAPAFVTTGIGCTPLYQREDLLGAREILPSRDHYLRLCDERRLSLDGKVRDSERQVHLDWWGRVTPFVESDSGVSMSMGTRTNMTFEHCAWSLGIMESLIMYQTTLDEYSDEFNAYVMFNEIVDTSYGVGSNKLKKLKGAIEDATTTTPTPRLCMSDGATFTPTLGGDRVRVRNGMLYRNDTQQVLTLATPTSESYFRPHCLLAGECATESEIGADCKRRRQVKLDALSDYGLHHLRSYLAKELLPRPMCAFLYEPIAVFGYTYSYHGLVLIKTLRPSDYIDVDNPVPDHPAVDDTRNYIREAVNLPTNTPGESMHSIIDYVGRVAKHMTTSKSAGYSTTLSMNAELSARLEHKGHGGVHKVGVEVRSSSKAMSESFMMMRMCSAAFMRYSGSPEYPLNGGARDVPGGRLRRLMYMLHTATQIPLQRLYVILSNAGRFSLETSNGVIDPMTYSSLRGDSTDIEKMWMLHVMSSRATLMRDFILVSMDYSTMDQHTGLQVKIWVEELLTLLSEDITYPVEPQSDPNAVRCTTSDPAQVTPECPLGIRETTGKFLARGLMNATHGWFASTQASAGSDGRKGAYRFRYKGKTISLRIPNCIRPPLCRTTFNTSGNNITALLNNCQNAVILVKNCILFGDDGAKFFKTDDYVSEFKTDLERARILKQKLDGQDCPSSTGATYLKNLIYGMYCIKRQRCLSKERPDGGFSPLSAKAELTSLYEACVRSGDDAGFQSLCRFYIDAGSHLRGVGYDVTMPTGWFCVGGELPRLVGPRPFNVNPTVLTVFSGHLQKWLAWLDRLPPVIDGRRTLFRADVKFTDEEAQSFSTYAVGIPQSDPPASYAGFSVVVRELKGVGKKIAYSGVDAVRMARSSFAAVLKTDLVNASVSTLASMRRQEFHVDGKVAPKYKASAMDYLHEMSYPSSISRQAAGVYADVVSYASKPAAIAERLSEQLATEALMEIKPLKPIRVGVNWVEDLGICLVTHTVVGSISFNKLNDEYLQCDRTYKGLTTRFAHPRIFDMAHGVLESFLVACFGLDTMPDSARLSTILLPERPALTYLQILRVMVICEGSAPLAAAILGVDAERLESKMGGISLDCIRVAERLLDQGSCRMTGLTGSIGYEVIRDQVTIHGLPDSIVHVESACFEFALAIHASLWLMVMNTLPDFGVTGKVTLPLIESSIQYTKAATSSVSTSKAKDEAVATAGGLTVDARAVTGSERYKKTTAV